MRYMGPAADDLTALVEKCKSESELTTVLEKCRQVLQGMEGKQKAEAFWAGVNARMPRV
jgi:hypothetical protein